MRALSSAQAIVKPSPLPLVHDFVQALAQLEGLPFRYLVPIKTMLPPESFRVFQVDPRWIDCLVAGALSLCRSRSDELDSALRPSGMLPVCGALVRSNVLVDWPSLVVEGFDRTATNPEPQKPSIVQLSPSVMMVLFGQFVTQIDIHPHPDCLHHGLTAKLEVDLRDLQGELIDVPVVPDYAAGATDRLDVSATMRKLGINFHKAPLPPNAPPQPAWQNDSSAIFALQVVQAVERGRFVIEWP
jgi:hypothetical protein